jgi:chromosome segregation ATPase
MYLNICYVDKMEALKTQIAGKDELIVALTDKSNQNERITSWQSRMASLQLANLQLSRDLEYNIQSKLSLDKAFDDMNSKVISLEEDLAEMQIETDKKQLEWEKRSAEMEGLIAQLEEEREKIFLVASHSEVRVSFFSTFLCLKIEQLKNILPDRSLPISHQLEVAIRLLVDKSQTVTAQEFKINSLESKIDTLKTELSDLRDHIESKDHHITRLKIDVSKRDLSSSALNSGKSISKKIKFVFEPSK